VLSTNIGQRAILACTPAGNVLWELALIDDATIDLLKGLGGVAAIAISHPHYYTTMVEWSRAFGGVPIHLHEADRQWVMRADPAVQSWGDTKPIAPGLVLGFGWEATSTHRPALGGLEGRSRRTALGRLCRRGDCQRHFELLRDRPGGMGRLPDFRLHRRGLADLDYPGRTASLRT